MVEVWQGSSQQKERAVGLLDDERPSSDDAESGGGWEFGTEEHPSPVAGGNDQDASRSAPPTLASGADARLLDALVVVALLVEFKTCPGLMSLWWAPGQCAIRIGKSVSRLHLSQSPTVDSRDEGRRS